MKNAEDNAIEILTTHLDELNTIADALLEYEAISGDEMNQIIKGEPIVRAESQKTDKVVRRRRKKTTKKSSSTVTGSQDIITKPAT